MPSVGVRGIELSYTEAGSGDPVVLLIHAFPLTGAMWAPQVGALDSNARFVVPDLKGFGASEAPEDASVYTMDAYADELAALLDHLDLAGVVVAGLSMGGYVGFALWRRHRERVRALVLADTRAEADTPEVIERRTGQQQQVRDDGPSALTEGLLGALLAQSTRDKKPDVVERVTKLMDGPAAGYIGALEAMKRRPDSTDDLAAIDVPTLVVVGEEDALTPPEAARKIHEHVGGSRLVVVPQAGHLSNLEAPDAFNGALAEFLSLMG
jgi:3-oxoadipate enol-lactonase